VNDKTAWNTDDARETYNLSYWSGGYVDVDASGHLVVRPNRDRAHTGIDLHRLAAEVVESGLSLPVLVRFVDILHDRIDTLCGAFARAMEQCGYRGSYTAVYPIKVNQQRSVVEEIRRHGAERVGLEAGSKPELLAVLALSGPDGVIVCNGYKDREYIRLALIGKQLGHRVFIVVEKFSELETVIEEARRLNTAPLIGVRVRLASIGSGNWQNTGGDKSKFGLSAGEVLRTVERLREANMLGCLQLLHFHLGSQVPNIRDIQRALRESGRYYAELHRLGVRVKYVDVGGGLGIDYEGTRSRSYCSMNYSVDEYAHNVVQTIVDVCTQEELAHPGIITESGRAMTAHHAVLLTNVIEVEQVPATGAVQRPAEDAPLILQNLWQLVAGLDDRALVEACHDAAHWLAEAQSMYLHGSFTLAERAAAERLYFEICQLVRPRLQPANRSHRELLDELNDRLADKYFCNFSVFQSVPDIWAIDQIFPIVPVHRLDEPPTRRGVLGDLTCDSDGRVDRYVDRDGTETTLPLHPLKPGEPYVLGIFLIGAYQEILGDMHNLFGDTDSVNVELVGEGGHRLTRARRGDTVDSVLRYVEFDAADLLAMYEEKIGRSDLPDETRAACLEELRAGLTGYTYLED